MSFLVRRGVGLNKLFKIYYNFYNEIVELLYEYETDYKFAAVNILKRMILRAEKTARKLQELSNGVKITAKLKPLLGKYYGTEIEVVSSDNVKATIKIWDSGDYTPSNRYLESYGYTEEQWKNNVLVYDGWNGKAPIRSLDLVCDSHFESKQSYDLAVEIVNRLNDD